MAKETTTPTATPIFTYGRSMMTELENQADKWLDYSLAQQGEAVKIMKTLRAQAMSATKSAFDAAEQLLSKGIQQ